MTLCGRGICMAESGHEGTCDEASFGVPPPEAKPALPSFPCCRHCADHPEVRHARACHDCGQDIANRPGQADPS